MQGVRYTWYSF